MIKTDRVLTIAAFTVAAAAGFAACSKKDTSVGPTEAVGTWVGTTSQNRAMGFTVSASGVTQATFNYQVQGSSCGYTTLSTIPMSPPLRISGGLFSIDLTQFGDSLFLSGSGDLTSATQANGTFLVQDGRCGTLNLTWTAAKQ